MNAATDNKKEQYSNSSTISLIEIYQNIDSPKNDRDDAFTVLCLRFRERVLNKCEVCCNRYNRSIVVAEIIAQNTFKKYAQKPGFDVLSSNSKNIDVAFELYLYGISKRELIDYHRKEKRRLQGYDYDGSEEVITDLPENIDSSGLNDDFKVKYAAIKSLSPKLRVVYLTYEYHQRKGFNLPSHILIKLREHLGGIKQTTVRGYRNEAIKIIEIYLNASKL